MNLLWFGLSGVIGALGFGCGFMLARIYQEGVEYDLRRRANDAEHRAWEAEVRFNKLQTIVRATWEKDVEWPEEIDIS